MQPLLSKQDLHVKQLGAILNISLHVFLFIQVRKSKLSVLQLTFLKWNMDQSLILIALAAVYGMTWVQTKGAVLQGGN